jgi:hypothetical protein
VRPKHGALKKGGKNPFMVMNNIGFINYIQVVSAYL